jgi:hypothetical protein
LDYAKLEKQHNDKLLSKSLPQKVFRDP